MIDTDTQSIEDSQEQPEQLEGVEARLKKLPVPRNRAEKRAYTKRVHRVFARLARLNRLYQQQQASCTRCSLPYFGARLKTDRGTLVLRCECAAEKPRKSRQDNDEL